MRKLAIIIFIISMLGRADAATVCTNIDTSAWSGTHKSLVKSIAYKLAFAAGQNVIPSVSGDSICFENPTFNVPQVISATTLMNEILAEEIIAVSNIELRYRVEQKASFDGAGGVYLRALVKALLDENNNLRQWITSFKSEVALSSNLADFKTRVAALPNMPDRTLAQAKTAIQNKIDDHSVDEP